MEYELKNYTYFSKAVMVFEQDGELFEPPAFVSRARTRYRFDHTRKILQKICTECDTYLDVQIFEDGEFRDIHDEDILHYMGEKSGYAVRCKECERSFEQEQKKEVDMKTRVIGIENSYFNLNISNDNKQFLIVISGLKNMPVEDLLDELLTKVRKYNNYSLTYDENL